MPRKYKRKQGVKPRQISWTKNDLEAALVDLNRKVMGINQISRIYNISARTLRRRQESRNTNMDSLGKHPVLGFENEKRLVIHIKKLEAAGFPPDRQTIRMLAFQFAEKLQLKHSFNKETQMAGHQWLQSFLERNKELSVRVAEGLSMARALGLNREEVSHFYDLLLKVLMENHLLDKPERIYNMDETGIQLNNKPGKVLATNGSRAVKMVTSAEKGETMTVVGCCNAVGNFLPPVVIIKGVNKKPEFSEGLPQGSKVFMNKRSAYINTDLFKKWLIEHFIANKPEGKVLLILDGHTSHSGAIEILEEANKHDVVLLCLPSHTTSALQPLDRAVYKPFKTFFSKETNHFMRTNPHKKISRSNVAKLIGKAWLRAATAVNALAGFRGSGIFPLDPNAIPDYEFEIAERSLISQCDVTEALPSNQESVRDSPNLICGVDEPNEVARCSNVNFTESPSLICYENSLKKVDEDETDCEEIETESQLVLMTILDSATPKKSNNVLPNKVLTDSTDEFTPSKYLLDDAPVPQIPVPFFKRGKQSAEVLNSKSKIEDKKVSLQKRMKVIPLQTSKRTIEKERGSKGKRTTGIPIKKSNKVTAKEHSQENKGIAINISKKVTGKENNQENVLKNIIDQQKVEGKKKHVASTVEKKRGSKRKKAMTIYSSSEDEANDNICCVCFEDYYSTKSTADWIRCEVCKNWLHETCTIFQKMCKKCGVLKI